MGPAAMYALTAFLACICLSVAIPTLPSGNTPTADAETVIDVPNGKAHVYKYTAVVSAGQDEPSPFASKFQIQGKLIHKNVNGDPNSKYMKLHEIKHTVYNGADDGDMHGEYHELQDTMKDFEEPFLAVYDWNKVKGIRVQAKEQVWSRNMKKSLAAIMQFDLKALKARNNVLLKPFKTTEKTIHGDCEVDYDIKVGDSADRKVIYVRKTYEPRKCSDYVQQVVSDTNSMDCKIDAEEDLVTFAEKIYEIEYFDNKFVIRKIISREKSSYLPWLHRSFGTQYIKTTQTLEFERVVDDSELNLQLVDFTNVPLINDVTFDNLEYIVSENLKKDIHFEFNTMDSRDLIATVKELLIAAVEYLKTNPIVKEVNLKYVDVFEKLHQTMGYLDSESMHYIFNHFNTATGKGNMSRYIFLEIIPHLGTYAAWNFTKNIIEEDKVEESIALDMLTKLPMYILNPNEEFAQDMQKLAQFDENKKSKAIKIAGILCYSILLHKTYKTYNLDVIVPWFLERNLEDFNERIMYEPTYSSKIAYMMAMRNVEVGDIYKYLAPIVRGEDIFFIEVDINRPEKYRMAAMWAVAKSISHDKNLTYKLFWPILANNTEPLSLRVTAYELLISRNPILDMNLLMNVHWMMAQEQNQHMFNYHYTTMQSMAESTDPCMKSTSEMFRKVLRLTRRRKVMSSALSRVKVFDYFDNKYGHGKTFKLGAEVDEASGIPQFGYYEAISSFARRPTLASGIYWNVEGVNIKTISTLISELLRQKTGVVRDFTTFEVSNEKVKNLLRQTHGYKLLQKDIRLEFWTINKGYVTDVSIYVENNLSELLRDYVDKIKNLLDAGKVSNRNTIFDVSFLNHYKMVVATDLGIPAVFYNQVPEFTYLKLKLNTYPLKSMVTTNLALDARFYHRSFYKMGFYNPFIGVTQSVVRKVTTDAALPVDMTVSFNFETRSLKLVLPRSPESKSSVAGVKLQSVDQVEVGNDHKQSLETYCPVCEHQIDITNNQTQKYNYEAVTHSVDTGLEYLVSISDCEKMSFNEREEWFRVFNTVTNNVKSEPWPNYLMIISQRLLNFMNSPHTSTCQTMLKASPCTVHPTSHIEMNWRFNLLKFGEEIEFNVRGSIDSKAAVTNNTMRFWNVDLQVTTSQFSNDIQFKVMRQSSEERNFKICVHVTKEYPNFTANSGAIKHETNTVVQFLMDESDGDQCSADGTSIKALIKGQLLDEQKERMAKNVRSGSCFKNPSNPLDLDINQRFDWNCLYQAVKGTTLRKYIIDVTYKQVSHEILAKLAMLDDYLRLDNFPHITYKPEHTEPGNVKLSFTYSVKDNYSNITVMNPYYSYELDDVLYGPEDEEDRHNDLVLDNTGFSTSFLVDFYKGDIRPCIVHSNDLINDLNQTISMDLKDWTLMTGDYALLSYAVLVKAEQENKVALRIYTNDHVLEVKPGQLKPIVILDGAVITNYEKGTVIPIDENTHFRFMMVNQLLSIEADRHFIGKLYYTPYNVIILPHIVWDRSIDGMCGHMGSTTYVQNAPLIYGSS
ncbi:vitellogenin-3-like isoform X1 [Nasonia vitripennis]|uniref:Vitellogenin domain-containing protein n=2 Tax=Nasonia vitripennis TaxID=7425 RepID=A0A7M7G7H4_NASVI|nr:vitellogenin-3-like isoform X1 [Nasonia vitripennis]